MPRRGISYDRFEMKKYVPPQAAPSRRNVIIKILTDNRCLMYFVNSVSHSSDCFDIVSIQLFANVLYMTVNDPIFDLQILRPQSVKQHLPSKNLSLIFKHKPKKRKLFAGQQPRFRLDTHEIHQHPYSTLYK